MIFVVSGNTDISYAIKRKLEKYGYKDLCKTKICDVLVKNDIDLIIAECDIHKNICISKPYSSVPVIVISSIY